MTHSMKRAAAAAVTLSAALVTATAPAATSAAGTYVALGDSYSAGVGTRAKVDSCYRSGYGYPALIAQASGLTLSYQACSGATTADVAANQVGALTPSTGYVTMTIGGNDVGFASTLTECALPGWMSNCSGKISSGRSIMANQMPARYDSLFGTIRSRASNAKVVIAGYPRIFNGEDCNAFTWFSPSEQAAINSATDDLDALIHTKAAAQGFGYVDVRGPFTGHAVCGSPEWINGLSNPIVESFHPNRLGNQGYASAISPSLVGVPVPAPQATAGRIQDPVSALAATARPGRSPMGVNLSSAKSLAGARAHGINPKVLVRLQAELESGDKARVAAAIRKAKALDAAVDARAFRAR